LTAASLERLKAPADGQIEYYDRRLPAFGLRVSSHGARSWFVMTRLDGKLIRVTLGRHPALALAEAREEARRAMNLASAGKDPRALKAEAKRKRQEERRNTFEACAAEFLQKHVDRHLRLSTRREYRRILIGRDTRGWRDLPITEIAKRDILDVIEGMDARGSPGAAKRALVYLRKFFNWCAERDMISIVPTDRVRPAHPEVKRDRVFSEFELRQFMRVLDQEPSIFSPLIRVLLLTGQRRAEVAGMSWVELHDLDGQDAYWEIPGSRTKNKQRHIVPISSAVRDVIQGMPRIGALVFTTTGTTPVSGFGKVKSRLDGSLDKLAAECSSARMQPWTLHDLRRTMVTIMNEKLEVAPHIVEAIVNHVSGVAKSGVAGVYNRALYLEARRAALIRWADYLASLCLLD
jgi:integrase